MGRVPSVAVRPETSAMTRGFSHVIGFDGAPSDRGYGAEVLVMDPVYAGPRLDAVPSAKMR